MSSLTGSLSTAVGRTRRLLRPPLTGDGLLLVGFLEGLIGWPLSWLFATRPGLAPLGATVSIVVLWVLLTAGIVAVGWLATAPTVRGNDAWVVWGVLNLIATGVNVLGVLDVRGLVDTLPGMLSQFAFWHPWLAVFGGGYLITALLDRDDRRILPVERVGYAVTGVASLLVLAAAFAAGDGATLARQVREIGFHVGAVLHLAPIGFDLWYDSLR